MSNQVINNDGNVYFFYENSLNVFIDNEQKYLLFNGRRASFNIKELNESVSYKGFDVIGQSESEEHLELEEKIKISLLHQYYFTNEFYDLDYWEH